AATETQTVADTPRLEINTPRVEGSISLTGGRIDDLKLKDYRETLDDDSPIVTLLSPAGDANAYYALYGWAPGTGLG
ncbi:YidC/Oxa1 family insertase periplasmic-domain containing protein, partial [Pseudomonas sp. SIMBA_044]